MFVKKRTYDPGVDQKYSEKITSLCFKDGWTYIGREDGVLECLKDGLLYSHVGFSVEFDYLENEDIKEKIVAIEKMNDGGLNDILFIANEKSIKVIKCRNDASNLEICNDRLSSEYRTSEVRKYANVHSYVLNSLSLNASNDYLISSDYIRVNLWRTERMEEMFTLRDMKPAISSGVVSVINASKFSPFRDGVFGFSTSSGDLCLNDIHASPKSQEIAKFRNPYCDGIKSVSDFTFSDQNIVVARALNNVVVFDHRNPQQPLFSLELAEDSTDQALLNSSVAIYEKFKISNNGALSYTGSFFGSVYEVDILSGTAQEVLVADKREFDSTNKTKHVVSTNSGFSCSFEGMLFEYSRAKVENPP